MRLLKMELNGFKSFANKTVVEFNDDFVGFVGPNGSGKSNIVDALKWVFGGTRNKDMRLRDSTEVIFNGSKAKVAKNYCEVSIHLDNQHGELPIEYNEVVISRRLYRDRKNEYYINDKLVRLKDIDELLSDVLIGKEMFTIVSQGKIDEITISSAKEKRKIIDEVAGVRHYQKSKEQAKVKLEQAEENLGKLEIIINELEGQLRPLEREASKAKEYQILNTEMEELAFDYLVDQTRESQDKYQQLLEEQKELESSKLQVDSEYDTKKQLKSDLESEFAEIKLKRGKVNTELETLNEDLQQAKIDLLILNERSGLSTEAKNEQIDLIKVKDELQKLRQKESSLNSLLLDKQEEFGLQEQTIKQINERLIVQEEKIMSLELRDRHKKYPFAVQKVIDHFGKELKVVKDLYSVNEKYELAISIALSQHANDLVCKNNEQIKQAIDLLHDKKFGRASFQNLSVVKPYKQIPITEGVDVAYAMDYVRCEEQYTDLFNNLLRKYVITEDFASGIRLSKQLDNRIKIVTLRGDLITSDGRVTGGSTNNLSQKELKLARDTKENLLTRKREIINEHELTSSKLTELRQELDLKQIQIKQANEKIELANMTAPNISNELNEKVDKIAAMILKRENDLSGLRVQERDYVKQIESISEYLEQLRTKKTDVDRNFFQTEIAIEKVKADLSKKLDYLRDDYNLGFDLAVKKAKPILDPKWTKERITELRKAIKKIGPVNLNSIAEYDKINMRYEYLINQREDLNTAKNKIDEIIINLNQIVERYFEDTFKKLQKEFNKVFINLFGGGTAKLKMTDPDDLLNTGVEIIVEPPGKKAQNLMLLSGGEKALTSIAFTISIMKIRDVPFIVFDEVEAALDEPNVDRFASYLQMLKKQTQFIVITHRQRTMHYVDYLYGVTMEQKGISTIIDLDVSKIEEK